MKILSIHIFSLYKDKPIILSSAFSVAFVSIFQRGTLKDFLNFHSRLVIERVKTETHAQVQLEKGSKIFLYTDGIPEARNANEQFGFERTLESLNRNKDSTPQNICRKLVNDIETFRGEEIQFDDITMMCLEYRGKSGDCHSVTIPADKSNIVKALAPIKELLNRLDVDPRTAYKLEVAYEEVLTNVASYAYDDNVGEMRVEYDLTESPRTLVVTVIDSGKPFNPLDIKEPDLDTPISERQIGGLGIFIVKKTMDDVEYVRKDEKNILIMKKVI